MARKLLVAVGLMIAVLFAGGAAFADYGPPPTITIDKPQVDPGGELTVTGQSCSPNAVVTIIFNNGTVATVTAGPDGTFSATFAVPAGTPPATYTIAAQNCVLGTTLTTSVQVLGTTVAALPRTGSSDTEFLLRTGVVLIAVGSLLVFAVSRRRAASQPYRT